MCIYSMKWLGFGGGDRISPALKVVAAIQAVTGPSYRAARDNLERFYGHRVLSHEGIRQIVLKLGKMIEADVKSRCENHDNRPKKKVPILFLESDGWHVSMQKEKTSKKTSKCEVKMLVSHEGWQRRTPGSSEYLLNEKTYYQDFHVDSDDFWDAASRNLYSKYDIDENTLVVINGDRAPWIRKGLEHFPNAMYQVDRFHVKRDIEHLLRHHNGFLKKGLDAFENSDIKGLISVLKQGFKTASDMEDKLEILDFVKAIRSMPESFKDYRVRLLEKGYDVSGLRGMGAAESNVDKFSDRVKKRGQSWRTEGLKAMLHSMIENFEGRLESYIQRLIVNEESPANEVLKTRITAAIKKAKKDSSRVKQGGVPIKNTGTTRSGGLSQLFWQLDYADTLIKQ